MAYKLADQSGAVTDNLTSFWFYMPFKLETDGGVVLTDGGMDSCHVAVLLDGRSIVQQPRGVDPNKEAGSYSLTLEHKNDGEIAFQHLDIVQTVQVHRNSEWAELRLYRGDGDVEERPKWIDASRWTRPPYGQDLSPKTWERTFSFGGIGGAVIDESVIVSNAKGKPKRVTLVRRLVQGGGLCDTVIGKGSTNDQKCKPIPELAISTSAGSKQVAEMAEVKLLTDKTQTNRRGFVMMTAGAFSWQSADSILAQWRSMGSSQDILERPRTDCLVSRECGAVRKGEQEVPPEASQHSRHGYGWSVFRYGSQLRSGGGVVH